MSTDPRRPSASVPVPPGPALAGPRLSGAAPPDCLWSVTEPGRHVVLSGAVDVHSAADLRLLLADQLDAGCGELVVDVRDVTAVDVTGLGLLVGAHRRAVRADRVLVLEAVSPAVDRMLHRTRLDRVLRHTQASAA